MKARDLVLVFAMCLCLSIAIGSGFYIIGGGPASITAMVFAIIALAIGQILVFGAQAYHTVNSADKLKDVDARFAARDRSDTDARRQSEFILNQFTVLRSEASRNADVVAKGFADLKLSYAGLAHDLQHETSARFSAIENKLLPAASLLDSPVQAALPASPERAAHGFVEQLLISLEPIVDMQSGRTAHYRIHAGMAAPSGAELAHDALLQYADRMGLRTQLDIFLAREAVLLLGRLRQRDAAMLMFMPIGAATLASPDALVKLLAERAEGADVSSGVVLDLPHAVLAGLNDQALEGLATLARHGVMLALSNVSITGLDLKALATLNVRYVGLDMGAIGDQGRPSSTIVGFAQTARVMRVNVIVTGVTNPQVISSLPQISRLASGSCFAAPRRVKRELAQQAQQNLNAAA